MKYQWLLILVLIGANIGCAKLGQTTITEDLLGEQADWLEGSSKSTDQLENNEQTEEGSEQEQGKTIDLANQKSTDISVKLTAKPEKKSSDQPVPVNPINCGHSLECDCQNFKKPPKLPHKLPHLQPANPHAAAPQLAKENYPAVDNHSLTPLNKKTSDQTTQASNDNFNSLRSGMTPKALGPLALQPKSHLKPLPSQALSPSIASTTNKSLEALPPQLSAKQTERPSINPETNGLTKLVDQPCDNCEQITCPGDCLTPKTSEDQGWNNLFAFDLSQDADCPDCESGSCETKDLIIPAQDPIVITEPPFEIAHTLPLAKAEFESDTSPRNHRPDTPTLSQNPDRNPNRQVNGIEPENTPTIERAFVPPTAPNREHPVSKVKESHSSDFVPKSNIGKPPGNPLPTPSEEKSQLEASIQKLESQLDLETDSNRRNALEVNLQLFDFLRHQLANDGTLTSISVEEKKYWEHQLEAIEMMTRGGGEATGGAADATLANLRKAMTRLESIAELQIKNGAFCCEITGFGKHKPFPENKFQPGQPILVYCEVENYESQDREIDSKTVVQSRFQGSYQIHNEDGQQVQAGDFPTIEDTAPQRRRDFYLYFKIDLNQLEPGNYRLRMEIEDLNAQKKGNLEQDLLFIVQ